MVSLQIVQQSNARIAALPPGLVALFIGATSGIGQGALQQLAQHASSPRIYSVARPTAREGHERSLASLRQSHPTGTYNVITADVSLIAEVDKVVGIIKQKETKLDLLFVSAGFMAFEGREDTREGLDPSMTTRYYSRLRAVQQLLPLLNDAAALSPRVVSVGGAGFEAPINELDLDLRKPDNWSFWNASVHTATMGTLALEVLARENPRLSIVHAFPGPVETPGYARAAKFGFSNAPAMTQEEAGARSLFLATSDCYAVQTGAWVPIPNSLGSAKKTGGGIVLADPLGESIDKEDVLTAMRKRVLDQSVWNFTREIFAGSTAQTGGNSQT